MEYRRRYEYNAVLIATLVALAERGPGAWPLDHVLHRDRRGAGRARYAPLPGAASAVTMAQSARALERHENRGQPAEHDAAEAT